MKRKRNQSRPTPSTLPEEPLFIGRDPDLPDELFDQFMQSVHAFESAPTTTLSRLLISDGMQLPSPDTFTEVAVSDKLWEVILGMAHHRNFLYSTNHLSDLELYRYLWEETLNRSFEQITPEMGDSAWHIDLTGDGSEESIRLWLRYYADKEERERWASDFPEDGIPERAKPPYDRDRHLPQR